MSTRGTISERLERRIDKSGDCWVWKGALNFTGGYGQITLNNRRKLVHRLVYEMEHRVTLRRDQYVCHRCDNPSCVRLDHLFLGTAYDNIQDAISKGRKRLGGLPRINAAKTECIRGHALGGTNLFIDSSGNRQCRECRRMRNRRGSARHLERRKERYRLKRQNAIRKVRTYWPLKTHCKRGHPFTDANTYIAPNRIRVCRACLSIRQHAYYQRKKATQEMRTAD